MISHKILIELSAAHGWIDGEQLTGRGLLGMFYEVLARYDKPLADALHGGQEINPFTVTPLFSPLGALEHVEIVGLSERCGKGVKAAWQTAVADQYCLHWGDQSFQATQIVDEHSVHIGELATSDPKRIVGLAFCSPTTFKAGPQTLPLPLSHNVFRRPLQLWNEQTRQQPMLQIDTGWLEWCERQLFVYSHNICTKQVLIHHKQDPVIGFVGEVWFRAHEGSPIQLSRLHALARFAEWSGVGAKTAMGMGKVAFIAASEE